MLLVKFIVLILLAFVIVSLFTGLYFLVKDKGQTNRTVNALTFRIGLSVLAIVIVLIAGATGVIEMNPSPLASRTAPANVDPNATDDHDQQPSESTENEESVFGSGGRRRIEE